jgi:methyltransferase (TIGR00027 family)
VQEQSASKTALATAMMRAFHQQADGPALLLQDPVALPLLGEKRRAMIDARIERYQSPSGRQLRAHVCLRSRAAEDRLEQAVARGVRSYVLVGAGFDTFAWRQPPWARELIIIEVDHPATQRAKREMLLRAGLQQPENLVFAEADFTRQTLGEVLCEHGLSREQPVCFSWLGVAMYLDVPAVEATLRAMADFAPGSAVTMTFKEGSAAAHSKLAARVADAGEELVSYFSCAEMEAVLRRCGFREVFFLTPEQARRQYFPPGSPLPLPLQTNIVYAAN